MNTYPHLPLADIELDPALVRRLPRKLAYYHLALPLATDGGELSLAMAHPENSIVLDLLQSVLGARIVPVHGDATEIRDALDRAWQSGEKAVPHLLSWGRTAAQAAIARQTSDALGKIFSADVSDVREDDLDTLLLLTQEDKYSLVVVAASASEDMTDLIRKAATPVLLLYGTIRPFQRIMLSLRGHSPDLSALDWVLPLATTYHAETTVLAVAEQQPATERRARSQDSLAVLLDPTSERAQHLAECAHRLTQAGVEGYLKLCQGDPIPQIVTEFEKGGYALLVIVSEAHGDFVQEVIAGVNARHHDHAILVVKPTPA
ncbi:MAG TPA: universal stress protein [Aggregatilineales bacterium]|nr:universal stress protein [Aggregatilineales bacterium]